MTEAVQQLLQAAVAAQREGASSLAGALFRQILEMAPEQPVALNALGMEALGNDDALAADLFTRAAAADPQGLPLWMNLATARRGQGDITGERDALEHALMIDQRHLMANVRLAELHERSGESAGAGFRWQGVASIIRSMPSRTDHLDQLLARASTYIARQGAMLAEQVHAAMAPLRAIHDGAATRRFDVCIEAMLGRRAIYAPAPHGLHFPFLPAQEFFSRNLFPWLAEFESATSEIIAELTALMRAGAREFSPYVSMMPGTPQNLWSSLNGSDDWSARYFWRYGERDADLCAQCPRTAAAIDAVPKADMPGRAPTAFFSILKPGAHLPPHTGVSNIRSIVHLPLIVPDGCGFRVGGETRPWHVGEAFVFDDTIEHEAWNRGNSDRAVLILDVWNPYLSETERTMLSSLFETLGGYLNAAGAIAE